MDAVQLVVTDLATNAICASCMIPGPYLRLWLCANQDAVLVQVWEAAERMPVPQDPGPGAPVGVRCKRQAIPQDIKIAVAVRDQGRCRCTAYPCHGYAERCNSAVDLHYDHVVPWSRGGLRFQNLQLLCGPCNLRKGADDIPG